MNSANKKGGIVYIESRVSGKERVYQKNLAKLSGGVMVMDHSSPFHDCQGQFYNNA